MKANPAPDQVRNGNSPYYPVTVWNGYLTAAANIHAPTTTRDHYPITLRRYVDASGFQSVQLENGKRRRTGSGLRMPYVDFLYAAVPRIPGQQRDNYGGYQKHGIGPQGWAKAYQGSAGQQPQDAGGVRQLMGDYLQNPGTS